MKIQFQAALGIQTSKFLHRISSFGVLQHRFFLFGARRQRRQPVNISKMSKIYKMNTKYQAAAGPARHKPGAAQMHLGYIFSI